MLVLALLWTGAARAERRLQERRAEAAIVLAQIRELDEEVGHAAERWNGANLRLNSIETELARTRVGLRRARAGYSVAQRRAADRLVELYVEGAPDPALQVVLGARSLGQVMDALDTRERMAEHDSNLVRELKRQRNATKKNTERLAVARAAQRSVVQRLAAARAAVESRLAERRRLLANVQSEVRRLEVAERVREAALQRRALAEVAQENPAFAEQAASGAAGTPPPQANEPAPAPPTGGRGAQVVAIAMRYLGVPYKWGGATPSVGFDCSGLTMYVFAQIGVSLPHYAAAQYRMGVPVARSQLQPGDLVFFSGLGHMGMYIGGGNFIHAPRTGDVVKISSLSDPYRVANWVGARRVL